MYTKTPNLYKIYKEKDSRQIKLTSSKYYAIKNIKESIIFFKKKKNKAKWIETISENRLKKKQKKKNHTLMA
jgi:hypothetical protein